MNKTLSRTKVSIALAALITTSNTAYAEQKQAEKELLDLERIVVTGATGRGVTKLESSVSITTLNEDQLAREMPLGTADLLEVIPGFWVEDSGGETNNNVAPRGLRGGEGFRYIGVQEDGLPVVYDGIWVDFYQRQDITTQAMEAVRGGTSGLLTTNGPAALVNFITKKPDDIKEGAIKFSAADYGMYRMDGYFSTPLNDDWKMLVGGFYRQSDGVRDTQFTADKGGQLRVNLVRDLSQGQLTLSAKHLDDHTTFFVPIPLQDQKDPKGIPSLDPQTGTMIGNGQQHLKYLKQDGSYHTRDLKDGQHTKYSHLGANLEWDFNDNLFLTAAARYSQFENDMYILLNFDNSTLVEAEQRLLAADAQQMVDMFADQGAVAAMYQYVDTGELIADPSQLNGNGLVTTSYPLYSRYEADQFVSKLSLTYENEQHSLTVGWLYAHVDADDLPVDKWESFFLTEVAENARLLDVVAVNEQQQVIGQLTDGGSTGYAPGWGQATAYGKSSSHSIIVNEEYQATDKLRLDAGFRIEWLTLDSTASGTAFAQPVAGAFDEFGNDVDNNLANNYTDMPSSQYFKKSKDETETAWTIGFNYKINDNFSVFGRYADAFEMPRLMSHGQTIHAGENASFNDTINLTFTEVGMRYSGQSFGTSLTLFNTKFKDLTERNFTGADGSLSNQTIDTVTQGLEFEASWRPMDSVDVEVAGVIQNPEMEGFDGNFSAWEGNQVKRTPKVQLRVTPTYYFDQGNLYLTVHHIGDRFSDGQNQFELPAYTTIDAGVNYQLSDNINLHVKGTNITDEIGLTEGNPRAINDQQAGYQYYYARPILGRTINASVTINF